ncbi:hypothetical protein FB451DRAFT_374422 [Mycena latifolia]|nr:hypothetical protein FB451DRAFT_374422 [Mycena latifolia]
MSATLATVSVLRLVVHFMIDDFDFEAAAFAAVVSTGQGLAQPPAFPDLEEFPKYRQLLHAFCDWDPSALGQTIQTADPDYDPAAVAYTFLVTTFVADHTELFRVYLELKAFLVTALSTTKISTPTPKFPVPATGTSTRSTNLKKAVQVRDAYVCRVSGYMHQNYESPTTAQARALPYQQEMFRDTQSYAMSELQVVHGIPRNPGNSFHNVIERMIGFPLPSPDTPENMVTLASAIHVDFGNFRLFFDHNWKLHSRSTPATARPRICSLIALPRYRYQFFIQVNDVDMCLDVYDNGKTPMPSTFWFQLHKLIGDVFYASGSAKEIEEDMERAQDTGAHALSDHNFVLLQLGLQEHEHRHPAEEESVHTYPHPPHANIPLA